MAKMPAFMKKFEKSGKDMKSDKKSKMKEGSAKEKAMDRKMVGKKKK